IKNIEIYGKDLPIEVVFSSLDSATFIEREYIKLHLKDNHTFELEETGSENHSTHAIGEEISKPFGTFKVVARSGYLNFINSSIIVSFLDLRRLAANYNNALTVEISNKENKEAKIIN